MPFEGRSSLNQLPGLVWPVSLAIVTPQHLEDNIEKTGMMAPRNQGSFMDLLRLQASKTSFKGHFLIRLINTFKSLQNLLPHIFLVSQMAGRHRHITIYLPYPTATMDLLSGEIGGKGPS